MAFKQSKEEQEAAILSFCESIRINTVSGIGPQGGYQAFVDFLTKELEGAGVDKCWVLPESLEGKPILVATIEGEAPEKAQILFNAHYDVVPVMQEDWTVPAFDAVRKEGKIYGRGTQDMKCALMGYVCAVKKLLSGGFKPHRTIHLTFVPDEEIGGADGMSVMLKSSWYEGIDIAIAFDEGLASEDDQYGVFYGERLPWWIKMTSKGNTGHASRFIEDTAVSSIIQVVNSALEFREEQRQKLHKGCANEHACSHSVARKTTLGDVTSLNVTVLKAGVQAGGRDVLNVIPATAEAGFDIRISPHQPPEEVEELLNSWCETVNKRKKATGDDGKVTWCHYNPALDKHHTTDCSDENPWWHLFRSTLYDKFDITLRPGVFPAATDSRFLRALGVKAFGFSPMRNCPILLHENDEYIPEATFLEGIEVYCEVISALSCDEDIA